MIVKMKIIDKVLMKLADTLFDISRNIRDLVFDKYTKDGKFNTIEWSYRKNEITFNYEEES